MMGSSPYSNAFFDLIKNIGESRSKQEEDKIIAAERLQLMQAIGTCNSQQQPHLVKEQIVRALYCVMLGHDASFAYIHMVKLCHDPNPLAKRTGYLGCCICLDNEHELVLLLVNTLQKDLTSANHLEVSSALSCVSSLATAEMAIVLAPCVTRLLKHSLPAIRKKAYLALQSLRRVAPTSIPDFFEKARNAICDVDPSVMNVGLILMETLLREDFAMNVILLRPLVPSLASILKQVIDRRLPRDYDYHRVPTPWIQFRLFQLMGLLCKDSAESSAEVYEVLREALRHAETAGINIGYALVFEIVRIICTIYPHTSLVQSAAKTISTFISSNSNNLRYAGVTAMAYIVDIDKDFVGQHQMAIVECLEDCDDTLKRKTLELLVKITSVENVEVVVEKLLLHIQSFNDIHLRRDLVAKITQVVERFAPTPVWFVTSLLDLLQAAGPLVATSTVSMLTAFIAEGPDETDDLNDRLFREEVVGAAFSRLKMIDHRTPCQLVEVLLWIVGEYGQLLPTEGQSSGNLNRAVVSAVLNLASNERHKPELMGLILATLIKIVCQAPPSETQEHLTANQEFQTFVVSAKSSLDASVASLASELLVVLQTSSPVRKEWIPYDGFCEDFDVTEELPQYRAFVESSMLSGARPYQPLEERELSEIENGEDSKDNVVLHFTPYGGPDQPGATVAKSRIAVHPSWISCGDGDLDNNLQAKTTAVEQSDSAEVVGLKIATKIWGPEGMLAKSVTGPSARNHSQDKPSTYTVLASKPETAAVPPLSPENMEKQRVASALFKGLKKKCDSDQPRDEFQQEEKNSSNLGKANLIWE